MELCLLVTGSSQTSSVKSIAISTGEDGLQLATTEAATVPTIRCLILSLIYSLALRRC